MKDYYTLHNAISFHLHNNPIDNHYCAVLQTGDRGLKSLSHQYRWHNKLITDWKLEPRFIFLSKLNLFQSIFPMKEFKSLPASKIKNLHLIVHFIIKMSLGGKYSLLIFLEKEKSCVSLLLMSCCSWEVSLHSDN